MPLPDSWVGVFWSPETNGHLLVDPTPDQFVSLMADNDPDPVFVILGGCLDLRRNGLRERSDAILASAKSRWPEFLWDFVDSALSRAVHVLPPIEAGEVPPQASEMLYAGFQALSEIARGVRPLPGAPD